MLSIGKQIENGTAAFVLVGRLDTVTSPQLEAELNNSLEEVSELTLDCGGLEYISSAGLRVLLAAKKTMDKQGTMKLLNVNEIVMEILDVTGFSAILSIE